MYCRFLELVKSTNVGLTKIGKRISKQTWLFSIDVSVFGGFEIMTLAKSLASIVDDSSILTVSFRVNCRTIADDAVLLVLEQLIFEFLLPDERRDVYLEFDGIKKNSIDYRYLEQSVLFGFRGSFSKTITSKEYIEAFEKRNHFRGIDFARWALESDSNYEPLYEEIAYFLKHAICLKEKEKTDEMVDELSNAMIEVAYNVKEHSSGELFIQFKVLRDLVLKKGNKPITLLCCSLMNSSESTIGGTLKKAMCDTSLDDGKLMVRKALGFHKPHFNTDYSEDNFYFLSSFQKRGDTKETRWFKVLWNRFVCPYKIAERQSVFKLLLWHER